MASFAPSVERWRAAVLEALGDDASWIDVCLAWITVESGGNECSTGIPGVEAGLAQTYHPDDDKYGATFAQLRAGCAGSTRSQTMTEERARMHVRVAVNLIRDKAARARTALASTGTDWTEGSGDFWSLAKLHHALPALYSFLGAYKSAHGGTAAPSWDAWKEWVLGLSNAQFIGVNSALAPWQSGDQRRRMFANAEKVGKYGSLEGVEAIVLAIAIPAVVAIAAHVAGKGLLPTG